MIYPIRPEHLQEEFLSAHLYPETRLTHYWSEDWDPAFYVALARAGFISISTEHPELGPVLIPELQTHYAVLDWEGLRLSRRLKKLLRSGRVEDEAMELRVVDSCERVVGRLLDYHVPETWLTEPYLGILESLESAGRHDFALHGVELWSRRRGLLVAGELGYSIGATYTSLSGFCTRPDREWRDFGTLQMVLLAERLRERGYAFWNMGHPGMPYKQALGARILPRESFLRRWLGARDMAPEEPLSPSGADELEA